MEPLNKVCSKCKEAKPASRTYYHADPSTRDGFASQCKSCRNLTARSNRKGRFREMINDADLADLISRVKECAICGSTEDELVVDHCDTHKFVRGMLCHNCNLGLGHFKDDPLLLEFARMYLLASEDAPEWRAYVDKESQS